jgi:outer membrane protein assembly factor BamB
MLPRPLLSLILSVLAVSPMMPAAPPEWPQFRGQNLSGVAESARPPAEFSPTKNLLWKVDVPAGASSPVIAGNRIFLTGFDRKKLLTFCLDRESGQRLWTAEAPVAGIEKYHAVEGSPAASSVATDGRHVCVYFGSCGLLCYDLEGREVWRRLLPVAVTDNDFGSGTSPILHDGRLYLARDLAHGSAVFCFSADTGELLWQTPREGISTSYSTPVIWPQEGREDLVVGGPLRIKGYDPKTGAERWLVRGVPCVNCSSPVIGDGRLYFGGWTPAGVVAPLPEFSAWLKWDKNGDGRVSKEELGDPALRDFFPAADANGDQLVSQDEWDASRGAIQKGELGVIAIRPGGAGDATASHTAWRVIRGAPYVSTPLFYQGRVYLMKDGGLASCVDAATGREIYSQVRLGLDGAIYASTVAAADRIYGISLRGIAFVYSAGDEPKLLARADLAERACATPAIVGKAIYYRTTTKVWAFGEK